MRPKRRTKCRQTAYLDDKPSTLHETGASPGDKGGDDSPTLLAGVRQHVPHEVDAGVVEEPPLDEDYAAIGRSYREANIFD
jgi:hypothetical protein